MELKKRDLKHTIILTEKLLKMYTLLESWIDLQDYQSEVLEQIQIFLDENSEILEIIENQFENEIQKYCLVSDNVELTYCMNEFCTTVRMCMTRIEKPDIMSFIFKQTPFNENPILVLQNFINNVSLIVDKYFYTDKELESMVIQENKVKMKVIKSTKTKGSQKKMPE